MCSWYKLEVTLIENLTEIANLYKQLEHGSVQRIHILDWPPKHFGTRKIISIGDVKGFAKWFLASLRFSVNISRQHKGFHKIPSSSILCFARRFSSWHNHHLSVSWVRLNSCHLPEVSCASSFSIGQNPASSPISFLVPASDRCSREWYKISAERQTDENIIF